MKTNDNPYADIVHLEYRKSTRHKPMSMAQRAAQFSSFQALTGYEDTIEETGRYTDTKEILDENSLTELDYKLQPLVQRPSPTKVKITYFVPDLHKSGGSYKELITFIERVDNFKRCIETKEGLEIALSNIYDLSF